MSDSIDFKHLVDGMVDAVVICDPQGAITYWNDAATRIFGFTREEAMSDSLNIIIPENQRKAHWDGYFATMKTGETRYGTSILSVPAVNKAGERLSIGFTVALLHNDDGSVAGIGAVMRDQTDKFKEERMLKKRVAELEAQLDS